MTNDDTSLQVTAVNSWDLTVTATVQAIPDMNPLVLLWWRNTLCH